jgi:CubicO group peptidase (beta-lactamase class C family)
MTELAVIDEVLAEAATAHGVPGAVAGVLLGDEEHVVGHGVGNVEHPRPVDADTLFQVGSITKTFVTAALMVLVERGALALEDPIARHLPGLGATTGLDTEAMTVEHVISHQAGFDGDHLLVFGAAEGLDALADARRFFAPGEGFSYCNAGFSIAGAVLEAVGGRPFEAVIRDELLRPLGMDAAGFRADWVVTRDVAAPHWVFEGTPYVIRGAGWQPGWELAAPDWAAGGLIASVRHLLRWCRFQRSGTADDGTTILGPESLARLHTPVVTADAVEDIALDWFVHDTDGVTSIEHGGATPGYLSDLVIVPERDLAFVGLTNATNGAATNRRVRRAALAALAGVSEEDPRPDPSLPVDVRRVCGHYEHAFALLTVTPGDDPGTVVVTSSARDVEGWQPPLDPPRTCAFFTPDHVVSIAGGDTATVARFDADGATADWLQWGSRRAPRVES